MAVASLLDAGADEKVLLEVLKTIPAHGFDIKISVHKGRGNVDRIHVVDKAHRRHAPVSQAPFACPVRNHQIFLAVRFQIVKIVKHLGIELS